MRTAQQFIEDFQDIFRENGEGVVKQLMIAYAREAIIEDRKNVAEHATCTDYGDSWYGEWQEDYRVDKDSIINAPQIELK